MKPTHALFLGSMVAGFAVLMGVVPLVVNPVPVSLKCDRTVCSWELGDRPKKTFPAAALASARIEPHQKGTRIVIDGNELSIEATGANVAEAHASAAEQMRAFAAGSAPTLALTYPCGGGDLRRAVLVGGARGAVVRRDVPGGVAEEARG